MTWLVFFWYDELGDKNMEIKILDLIQTISNPVFDQFFSVFTRLNDHGELWILILFFVGIKNKNKKIIYLGMITIILEFVLISGVLKPLVQRPRPYMDFPFELLIKEPSGWSFPSGHAASSFSIAGIIFFMKEPRRWFYMFLAALMAFSRLYLYVHYPSDVFLGSILGLLLAYFVVKNEDKLIDYGRIILDKIHFT